MLDRLAQLRHHYNFQTMFGDVLGGITAAVVGLPVALAFGVSSGLGAAAGIYGAVAVGFFAAVFGGTRSLISGPTGSMTVAMAVIVTTYAQDMAQAFTIVIMAGLIQMIFGFLRIGRFVSYTPYSVIAGFMTGVGIIILSVQILPFMGADPVTGGPVEALRNLPGIIEGFDLSAVGIAGVTLGVAIIWPSRLDKYLPSTLVALFAGIIVTVLWFSNAPTIGNVPTDLPVVKMPALSFDALVRAIEPAMVLALVGSADTLLTALVGDSMTRARHDPNKELFAQGIGAVVTGFIQGLPGSGATPSTIANIRAGGRTVVSGVIAVVILVVMILVLGDYVARIPNALLAGVLMKVALDTMEWRFVTRLLRIQREHMVVMLLTLGLTVFLDLVTAIAVGMIAAAVTSARQFERLELDSVVSVPILDQSFFGTEVGEEDVGEEDVGEEDVGEEDVGEEDVGEEDVGEEDMESFSARVGLVALRGSFTVASSRKLLDTIGKDIREHEVVILDFSSTVYMDESAALVMERLIETATRFETHCIVMGLAGMPARNLEALNVLKQVPSDQRVQTWDEARLVAARLLAV